MKEELIRHIEYNLEIGKEVTLTDDDCREIIKALSAEPCEDAISRQAVLDVLMPYCADDDGSIENTDDLRNALDDIESLPPVQPIRPKGEWIKSKDGYMICNQCG